MLDCVCGNNATRSTPRTLARDIELADTLIPEDALLVKVDAEYPPMVPEGHNCEGLVDEASLKDVLAPVGVRVDDRGVIYPEIQVEQRNEEMVGVSSVGVSLLKILEDPVQRLIVQPPLLEEMEEVEDLNRQLQRDFLGKDIGHDPWCRLELAQQPRCELWVMSIHMATLQPIYQGSEILDKLLSFVEALLTNHRTRRATFCKVESIEQLLP
ncbi:hypothetical protein EDD21DRAFT_392230, partial [Dissophora ornata]